MPRINIRTILGNDSSQFDLILVLFALHEIETFELVTHDMSLISLMKLHYHVIYGFMVGKVVAASISGREKMPIKTYE